MNFYGLLITRLAFGALFLFEVLSYARVIQYQPTFTWFGLLLTIGIVWLVFEIGQRWRKGGVPLVAWVLGFVAVAIDAFGDIFHWYTIFPLYDKVVHFTVSGIVTLVLLLFISARKNAHLLTFKHYVLVFAIMQALGVLYELEEYWEDYFFQLNFVRWGGSVDTVTDLICNAFGSATALIVFFFVMEMRGVNNRRKRKLDVI